jgi:hypothetical protein
MICSTLLPLTPLVAELHDLIGDDLLHSAAADAEILADPFGGQTQPAHVLLKFADSRRALLTVVM